MHRFIRFLLTAILLCTAALPTYALAQGPAPQQPAPPGGGAGQGPFCQCNLGQEPRCLCVNIGTILDFQSIAVRIINFLAVTIVIVCSTIFILGAFHFVMSRGQDSLVQKGKELMTGSLIGLGVTLGAYAIVRTVYWVLYYG